MKTWNETRAVLEVARSALAAGQPCALALLTHVKGSSFRRPGAKLLIRADGSMTGNVSGGCLENDLRERALRAMQSGQPESVHYQTGSDEDTIWGLGLGCDGELDLLVRPIAPSATWPADVLRRMETHEAFALDWPADGEPRLADFATDPVPGAFRDHLEPPPDLVIVGAGDDAIPLVELAIETGFRVTVTDHRPGYLPPHRFPRAVSIKQLRPDAPADALPHDARTLVVIKNHALEMDKQWAARFARTDVAYIGLLGPHARCDKIRAHMGDARMERVFGPVGLDLGAEGAEQIAVSIVAQLLSVWRQRDAVPLSQRAGSIHRR